MEMTNITELSEMDILQLQFNILEELKQKKSNNRPIITETSEHPSVSITSQNPCDEFILQKFSDNLGNVENNKEYNCRIVWFDNSCPTYKELSKITGTNINTICAYASKYSWSEIKNKAFDLGYRLGPNPRISQKDFVDNPKGEIERNSKEYRVYHDRVLKRDEVCQCCGSNEDLEVHHPMPFNQYNSLGADTNNGIVLCKECHTGYHSQFGKKERCNPATLAQFFRDYAKPFQSTLTPSSFDEGAGYKALAVRLVISLIKTIQRDAKDGICSKTQLLYAVNEDIPETDVDFIIKSAIQKGLIYSPVKDGYRIVE